MSNVRVRFAPSPTGFFHIGSARTALFNWLYARHTGGTFVLRIEDTDKERNKQEYLDVIYDSLRWLGMDWDEGPGIGGAYGPYFQSQRNDIYAQYLQKLHDAGRTYEKDGAVWFRLEGERSVEFDSYKGCEVEKVDAAPVVINDAIRGRVERAETQDFVIIRSNGEPVFHLVNVIDDIAMGITHVIRGEDHLSNTSKHVLLFEAFGAQVPVFAHMPLILKDPSIGKGKMSKRDRGALIEEYRERNFIPEAVRNYLCLLGWNPKDDREILEIDEVARLFELEAINKDNARFDEKKMAHINTEHLRALSVDSFVEKSIPVLSKAGLWTPETDAEYVRNVMELSQGKARSFEDLAEYVSYFFSETYAEDPKARTNLFKKGEPLVRLAEALQCLEGIAEWTAESLQKAFDDLAQTYGHDKPFAWFPVIRFSVSGVSGGPDLIPMLVVMGRGMVLARMKAFLSKES
ncbi:MAG: glutamate--tRNA ligase [Opitutales bacterium]|nr:glutamate--tRNA ligase [Opitutales bacterium]